MPLSVRVALTPPNASLAQLEEHRTFNARARSSSLRRRTTYVACSSVGQNAGLWPRRSAVRARSRTPHGRIPFWFSVFSFTFFSLVVSLNLVTTLNEKPNL